MPELLCEICKESVSKYKCPKCTKRYCSLPCYKTHKETPCHVPTDPAPAAQSSDDVADSERSYNFMTSDTIALEKLQQLGHSEEVKQCLANPHVRNMLKSLVESPDVEKAMQDVMQEPIFLELAEACLKVVQNPERNDVEL